MALHCAPSVPQTKKKSRFQAWKYQNFAVPIWGSFFDAEKRDGEMQHGVSLAGLVLGPMGTKGVKPRTAKTQLSCASF